MDVSKRLKVELKSCMKEKENIFKSQDKKVDVNAIIL